LSGLPLDKLQKRRGKKQCFDEKSSPAIASYLRLLIGVGKLAQANSDEPKNNEKNSNKTENPEPITQTAAAGSTEISFGKKDRATEAKSVTKHLRMLEKVHRPGLAVTKFRKIRAASVRSLSSLQVPQLEL